MHPCPPLWGGRERFTPFWDLSEKWRQKPLPSALRAPKGKARRRARQRNYRAGLRLRKILPPPAFADGFRASPIINRKWIIVKVLIGLAQLSRQIGICRFPNTFRFFCRGGIHASRVRGTFSPKRSKNRNVVLPGGMNASPTVFIYISKT